MSCFISTNIVMAFFFISKQLHDLRIVEKLLKDQINNTLAYLGVDFLQNLP